MEVLIDHGAGLSKVDALKRTPFECAVRYNRMEAVEILLENHVNVNVKNRHGVTALHLVSDYKYYFFNGKFSYHIIFCIKGFRIWKFRITFNAIEI